MERRLRSTCAGRLRCLHIQIDDHRVLTATDYDGFTWLIGASVYLLVRNERRNIDEITRPGFITKLKRIAPAHASAPAHNVEHCFQLAMMMRPGFGIRLHDHSPGPKLGGAGTGVRNGSSARHPRRLRSVSVQGSGANDFDAVLFPVHSFIVQQERPLRTPQQGGCEQRLGGSDRGFHVYVFIRIVSAGAAWSEQQSRYSKLALQQERITGVRRG